MIDRAQRRLLLALVASALLHWWLAHTADSPGARRMNAAGGEPVRATLAVPESDTSAPQTALRVSPLPESRGSRQQIQIVAQWLQSPRPWRHM